MSISETKTCIACGMPMKDASEHAMNDVNKDYCIHCANQDGSMHSFEEKRVELAKFIVQTQGLDETAALDVAENMMKKLPAWEGDF